MAFNIENVIEIIKMYMKNSLIVFLTATIQFEKNHRFRVVITGADAYTNLTIPQIPTPRLSIKTSGLFASQIQLPLKAASLVTGTMNSRGHK